MRRLLSALALLLLASVSARGAGDVPPVATSPYDPGAALTAHAIDVVDYTLTATLDPVAHCVHGAGTIRWTNTSRAPTRELWLHLYLNAFKNEKSVFQRDPVGAFRGGEPVRDWGSIDVRKLEWHDGNQTTDLWHDAELHRAGDDDETDARVPLPREVAAGESITLDVVWDDKLPSVVERTGYDGSFHMVAQWFPKLARLEADGTWRHFPFYHLGEFYADFGTYDVTIHAPKNMIIGATGPVVDRQITRDEIVERHVQADVHDFAWTAWSDFSKREELIDGVQVTVLYPPHFELQAERELRTIRFALPYFGKTYGKYPYSVLTLVHPPESAAEAGGMEYPTLITTGGSWYAPPGILGTELVTIHEFGHQYFYGLLASNEVEWPFLDEGLNSFAEQDALRAWLGESSLIKWPGVAISDAALQAVSAYPMASAAKVAQPAYGFASGAQYGRLVYSRTAVIFETLRRVYGDEPLKRALGRYARRARFGHPVPEDLLAAVSETLGPQAAGATREALFNKGTIDYEVTAVSSNARRSAAGLFDVLGKRESVLRTATPNAYDGWALITRKGTLALPVEVALVAHDGTRSLTTVSGLETSVRVAYSGASPLAYAVVDPERKILLDGDTSNNAGAASGEPRGSTARTLERVSYWTELALGVIVP